MGCIEQKLGSGVIELKNGIFTFFVKFTTKSIDENKANLRTTSFVSPCIFQ